MDPSTTAPPRLVDFDTIEQSKENIAPAPRGRSAVALAKAFGPISHSSPQHTRDVHSAMRAQFEKDIASSIDLDDPLEVWLRYIKWTDETFPQGQSTESGIARLLERCTEHFKNDKQYKSDPRYLRVWLAYSTYSDSPLDIFAFLQRNGIGQELALFYEEYAAVLEKMNRKRKADEIFQMGLLRDARPMERLRKRYDEFKRRLEVNPPDPSEPSTPPAPLRTILGASQVSTTTSHASRPRKIQVFADTEEPESRPGSAGWESIGTLAERKKENTIAPKPWAGETMPMRGPTTAAAGERLVVFRDEAQPKRSHEHVAVNLEQIYVDNEEFSFEELLAKKRGIYGLKFEVEKPRSPIENAFKGLSLDQTTVKRSPLQPKPETRTPSPKAGGPSSERETAEDDGDVYMPIRDEDSSPKQPRKRRPSPTINTKAALDDIIDIFSRPLKSKEELEASSSEDESDAASLTSRSFGNQSDAEEGATEDRPIDSPSQQIDEPEKEDEVNIVDVSKDPSIREEVEPTRAETNVPEPINPSEAESTPPPQFSFPVPVPPAQQPQPQPIPERRFNVQLMTPIVEERTETSFFQSSQDGTSTLSPFVSHHHPPQTPPKILSNSHHTLDSSPFEEYIPKPRSAMPSKLKRPVLQPKKAPELKEQDTKITTGPIIKETQCNPMDAYIRQQVFEHLRPGVETYEGFVAENRDSKRVPEIESFFKTRKDCVTQNLENRVVLAETEYLIRKKLGEGGFGPVFLAEAVSTGELHAIKIERKPPSKWEFYIMRQAKRRLGVSRAAESMIDALGLYLYRDESYLILEYRDQGTLLDLVKRIGVMDEMLAMFFTIELLRTVEALHSKGILHGDLKADNCLVRFDEGELNASYRRDGSAGWSSKGIALIDFGRGIDMRVFSEKVQFIADWKTDEQDCPEMQEMRPWTYQVDYWGVACIIHSMLYAKYISTISEPVGMGRKKYLLREQLKRYWQQDLWKGLLEVLLNPMLVAADEGGLPLTNKLKEWREKMETWLEENSEKGVGLRGIIRRIESDRKTGK